MLLLGGLVVTVTSSLVLARELDRIGERLGFSEALLGIVTALGADGPEIASAVVALISGHNDTGVGVVVGSNVFNIAALLGLSAVLAPYVALSALRARRLEWLPARLREAVREEQEDARLDTHARLGGLADALGVVPALAGVIGGATAMVYAAQSLGDRWGVSDLIIGTIVLAALTGIPNLIAAVRLALHGRGAACVSESLNSNNANILVGLCIPALILGIGSASGVETFGAWWMVGMTLITVALGFGGGLTRREGAMIVGLYVVFAVVVATAG